MCSLWCVTCVVCVGMYVFYVCMYIYPRTLTSQNFSVKFFFINFSVRIFLFKKFFSFSFFHFSVRVFFIYFSVQNST